MKITTDTPDLLIVENRPLLLGILLILFSLVFIGAGLAIVAQGDLWGLVFGAFGGGMGILFFFVMVRRTLVVFHRPEGYVEIRTKSATKMTKVRHTLSEIDRAVLQTSSSSDGPDTHRVALVISEGQSVGTHPLTEVYTSGSAYRGIADRINDWMKAGREAGAETTP